MASSQSEPDWRKGVPRAMAYDCFISYASADLNLAEELHRRLTAAGFSVWFDKARLVEGCSWHQEIEAGCEASRVLLPLLTPRWKLAEWTRYETYGAEEVIPLLAEGRWEDVSTPPLARYQNHGLTIGDERLFAAIRQLLAQPAPEKSERIAFLRYRANPYFVGREDTLADIHEKFFSNPTAELTQGHVEVVTALGGVGKTTLARQYAEKFWRCYRQMFWVDCRQPLESEFAAIHDILRPEPLYLPLKPADKAHWARYELNQTAQRPLRLLILDNAENEEAVLAWIPRTGNCHTLITSRFTAWSPGIETCPVWVLAPEPARELLLRRSSRGGGEATVCDVVARKLGCLPLALEQAAAYIGEQGPGYGFADYLRLYEGNERKFLARRAPGTTEYPDSVYLTWRTTVDKLAAGARAILRLCAFFAPAALPVAMFVKDAATVAEGEDGSAGEYEVRDWIAGLVRYSMVNQAPGDSFAVHALVQAVERHHLDEQERSRMVERAVALLAGWAPESGGEFDNWADWKVAAPHAEALWQWQRDDDRVDTDARFLNSFGLFEASQGRYSAAEPLFRRALELRERVLGAEHPDTLTSVNNLAQLLSSKGDYEAAEPLLRRALGALQRVLGSDHPNTIGSTNNLALLLVNQGNYKAAEPLLRRALEEEELVLGADHPDTLNGVNNLAQLLANRGDYGAAEPLFRRALEAMERVLGAEHPSTLTSLNNLALLLMNKGDFATAEPLFRRALGAMDRVLGGEHPLTLKGVNNLAQLLTNRGDYGAAESLYRRALAAQERILGPEHPDTLASVHNLAVLLWTGRDYQTAEPLFRRALGAMERVLGAEHPTTRTVRWSFRVLRLMRFLFAPLELLLRLRASWR
jgi:tetratricopeptide (TPR) repeat protein